ncbi:MAG: substrate-binding domain-containing protein, partial [Rhodopirellula sp. JB053]
MSTHFRMTRHWLAVGSMIMISVIGCSSKSDNSTADGSSGENDKPVIGFVQTGSEGDWRKAHTVSVREAAEAAGYELRFADGQAKQENQIKALSSFVAQGVDGIILAPLVETG